MDAETHGLLGSENIPVAEEDAIDAEYCLGLLRRLRDVSFATVSEDGLPTNRIIDVMHVENGRLYFLTARGKPFYSDLTKRPYVAISAMTCDYRMVRLEGPVVHPESGDEQRRLVDRMFELNPSMKDLYRGDARYVLEVFYVEEGRGEYYDLGREPLVRVDFAIGASGEEHGAGFVITDECRGCGICSKGCPQDCIAKRPNGKYRIRQSSCLRCGYCFEICPFDAIERKGRSCE